MDIQKNIPLSQYTTMRLGGPAKFVATARSAEDVDAIYGHALEAGLPITVIGGGSNLIVHDEGFAGVVILNRIPGFEIIEDNEESTLIKIGGGEVWDDVVKRTVDMSLTGIEALSAIPGTAGAAPVQNVGAYGQEVADTLQSLEAYDTETRTLAHLTWEDCGFAYRQSIFREGARGKYIITSISLRLYKRAPEPPFYAALERYFTENNITEYTPQIIRDAVIAIRSSKLPDPSLLPNSGSFFKNAIIEEWQYNDLQNDHPDIPGYKMEGGRYKVPTGWLIDNAELKGRVIHGIKVHDDNALVLINESATGYADLAAARQEIIDTVRDTYRITIEQEPLEL